jgi:hypothetical protein
MLLARASCRLGVITPALLHILSVVEEHARFHDYTIILLSGTDGAHALYSGHARGEAIDFRCRDLVTSDEQRAFLHDLLTKLGPEFYGAQEHTGQANEHYHLQLRRGIAFHAPAVPTHVSRFSLR